MSWTWMSFVEAELLFGTLAVLGCPVGRLHYDPPRKISRRCSAWGYVPTYRGSKEILARGEP